MLDAIRFAAAGTSRKDYTNGYTHFSLRDGRVVGFNGEMALSAELGVDLEARPLASTFAAAVRAAGDDTISLNMTPAGRLALRAGKFRAYVQCDPEIRDYLEPVGEPVDVGPAFMDGVRAVAPVMGFDASRPWASGIKLQAGSMFATNNVMVVQYWHGARLPVDVVIPAQVVHELLRVGQAPTTVQVTENRVSFTFEDGRWITSVVLEGSRWPLEKIEGVLDGDLGSCATLPDGFFDAVRTLKPFLDEDTTRVYVTPAGLRTSLVDGDGADVAVEVPGVVEPQPYSHRQLTVLERVADAVDWSSYPRPCRFVLSGTPMRGVMVGMRA